MLHSRICVIFKLKIMCDELVGFIEFLGYQAGARGNISKSKSIEQEQKQEQEFRAKRSCIKSIPFHFLYLSK